MKFIVDWVSNIVVFILLATVLSMILPNSNIGKYVKMVVGLLLITIIINPLFQLFKTDITQVIASFRPDTYIANGQLENQLNLTKKEIQGTQRAYILEQMAVQLKRQVQQEMLKEFGKDVTNVDVVPKDDVENIQSPDDLKEVTVTVRAGQLSSSKTVDDVRDVVIDTTAPYKEQEEIVADKEQIIQLLSEKWGIGQEKIKIGTEGGTKE